MGGSESRPNPSEPDVDGFQTTKINVGMTCEGCAGAVKRILNKVDGVEEVNTDVGSKSVLVKSKGITPDKMLEPLMKWSESSGKSVDLPATQ